MEAPRVLAEAPSWMVVYKPPLLHSAPLREGEGDTLLHWCARRYPEVRSLRGRKRGEGGILHRLDYGTSGLVLFARTQAALDALSAAQDAGLFVKRYAARSGPAPERLPGFPPAPPLPPALPAAVESAFRPWGPGRRAVRPLLPAPAEKTRVYRTLILQREGEGDQVNFRLEIRRGFRHQIRCHLAWLGFPLRGDTLYGGLPDPSLPGFALRAEEISFPDPATGETRVFTL